jgi:hypothetical protein
MTRFHLESRKAESADHPVKFRAACLEPFWIIAIILYIGLDASS